MLDDDYDHPQPDRYRNRPIWILNSDPTEHARVRFDDDDIGLRERWFAADCMEGWERQPVLATSFHQIVWHQYPWTRIGKNEHDSDRFLLHFTAVDYEADIWANGQHVAHHIGGQTAFEILLPEDLVPFGKKCVITVRAKDTLAIDQPRGKQFWKEPGNIMYTPQSGVIGQVWLEKVPSERFEASTLLIKADVDNVTATIECEVTSKQACTAEVQISLQGEFVSSSTVPVQGGRIRATVAMGNPSVSASKTLEQILTGYAGNTLFEPDRSIFRGCGLWSPEHPILYDVELILRSSSTNEVLDTFNSYIGMRKLQWSNGTFLLNGKPYFQRLVLDQGYWPESGLIPPSGAALKKDIELAKAMGFNGARKHQKLEDQRYHYWCDKLGFLLWSEMPNGWAYSEKYVQSFTMEWMRSVKRSMSHPCIVAWVPINESWGVPNVQDDERQRSHLLALYHLTKSLDPSRPVVINDGWETMSLTDLCCIHDYGSPSHLSKHWASLTSFTAPMNPERPMNWLTGEKYAGQPIICSEMGGTTLRSQMNDDKETTKEFSYGYEEKEEEWLKGIKDRIEALTAGGLVQGFCWTQLTDCEQETNGLLDPQRRPKADLDKIRAAIRQLH